MIICKSCDVYMQRLWDNITEEQEAFMYHWQKTPEQQWYCSHCALTWPRGGFLSPIQVNTAFQQQVLEQNNGTR